MLSYNIRKEVIGLNKSICSEQLNQAVIYRYLKAYKSKKEVNLV